MTINRSALRRTSAAALLKKTQDAAAAQTAQVGKDSRFWEPTVDKEGNGYAVIRFLPSKFEDGVPFVKVFNHGFKAGAKWFIENCPTTPSIGGQCPVCDANSELWNTGLESNKKIASSRKRKLRYISNIIVIKDPKNPENEGKVFLFSYGQKIFEKLESIMNPPEQYGEEPRDPFGFFDGAIMKLKIKKQGDFRNYDDSVVEAAQDLYDGDEDKLSEVLEAMHDVNEFIAPSQFKAFDVLAKEFAKVTGTPAPSSNEVPASTPATNVREYSAPVEPKASRPEPTQEQRKPAPEPAEAPASSGEDDDDDDLAYFRQLAAKA